MSSTIIMNRNWRTLLQPYQTALGRYLKTGSAAGLKIAPRLGRRAAALGMETLDLALIHEQTSTAQLFLIGTPATRNRLITRARKFFAEAIVPMEEAHRSALEANVRLRRLNQSLGQRTRDIDATNRQLKKEIAKRRAIERTLRQSEQQAGRLLKQSRHMQEQLRLLSRQILSAQEEERKRISRELHDVIAQMLAGIHVQLGTLKAEATANSNGLNRKISSTQRLVEKSVDIVHQFARELRPVMLDDLGLIPALHSFMKNFTEKTGIRSSLAAFAGVEKLSSAKRTTLYRVAQEALTNVALHAHAGRVQVSIKGLPNAVHMQIKDNGQSFEADRVMRARKSKPLGLIGMRERVEMVGGTFTVESSPGDGTSIHAQIPLKNGTKKKSGP